MSFDEQPDDMHGECAAEIHRLRALNAELMAEAHRRADECRALRKQAGELAVLLLQNDREEVMQWARGVKITFPDGEPELGAASAEPINAAVELARLVRRIEIICDATNRDPLEYLAERAKGEV